jgi:hypothetical protein
LVRQAKTTRTDAASTATEPTPLAIASAVPRSVELWLVTAGRIHMIHARNEPTRLNATVSRIIGQSRDGSRGQPNQSNPTVSGR